jgi:hypothetical protein
LSALFGFSACFVIPLDIFITSSTLMTGLTTLLYVITTARRAARATDFVRATIKPTT